MQYDAIIIGAGLTGLATGFYLNKAGKKIIIIDKRDRVGGVIETVKEGNFIYELGPNTGLLADIRMEDFLFEIEDDDAKIEYANKNNVGNRYIAFQKKWQRLPKTPIGGLLTPLFSWRDKFSLPFEPFRKRGINPEETLAEMVIRRMGKSFLDYTVDPFILGVYAGDPSQLIPKYGLQKLYDLEQDFGSFIGGTIKKMIYNKKHGIRNPTRKIFSFKNGLSNLTENAAKKIGLENFLLGIEKTEIIEQENGQLSVKILKNGEEQILSAKKIITACGSFNLPEILPFIEQEKMQNINNLLYTKVVEVQVGFENWHGEMKLNGFGGLCPFIENHDILGILFMSAMHENRAPKKGGLFTVFLGGVRRQDVYQKNDADIYKIVKKEFCQLMQLDEERFHPELLKIIRHEYAIPQYGKESKIRFETIAEIEKKYPNLILGGNFIGGIGMSKRIVHGYEIAKQVLEKG